MKFISALNNKKYQKKTSINQIKDELKELCCKYESILLSTKNEENIERYIEGLLFLVLQCTINIKTNNYPTQNFLLIADIIEKLAIAQKILSDIKQEIVAEDRLYTLIALIYVMYIDKNYGTNIIQAQSYSPIDKITKNRFLKLSINVLNNYINDSPLNRNLLLKRFYLFKNLNEYSYALELISFMPKNYEKLLKSDKKNILNMIEIFKQRITNLTGREIDIKEFMTLTEIYFSLGMYAEALKAFELVLEKIPYDLDDRFYIFYFYFLYKTNMNEKANQCILKIENKNLSSVIEYISNTNFDLEKIKQKINLISQHGLKEGNISLEKIILFCLSDFSIDFNSTLKLPDETNTAPCLTIELQENIIQGFNLITEMSFEKEEKLFQHFFKKSNFTLITSEEFLNEFYNIITDYACKVLEHFNVKFKEVSLELHSDLFSTSYQKIIDIYFRYIKLISGKSLHISKNLIEKKVKILNQVCKISIQAGQKLLESSKEPLDILKTDLVHKSLCFYKFAYYISKPMTSMQGQSEPEKKWGFLEGKFFELENLYTGIKKDSTIDIPKHGKIEKTLTEQEIDSLEPALTKQFQQKNDLAEELELQKILFEQASQQIYKLKNELKIQQQTTTSIETQNSEKSNQITKLTGRIEQLQKEVEIAQEQFQENTSLKQELELQKQKIDSLELALTKQFQQKNSLAEELELQKILFEQASQQIYKLKNELKIQQQTTTSIETQNSEKSNQITKLTGRIEQLQKEVEIAQEQFQENTSLKQELELQKQKNFFLETNIYQKYQCIEALQQQVEILQKQPQHMRIFEKEQRQEAFFEQSQYRINLIMEQSKIHLQTQYQSTNHFIPQLPQLSFLQQESVSKSTLLHVKLSEELEGVLSIFIKSGYYALMVGGAVRDLLIGKPYADIDIITNMPSSIIFNHFKKNFVKTIPGVSGLHQMIFAGIKIEIMCCKTDIFLSKEALLEDAQTRAFTINALYCDIEGMVYDPLNMGLNDLLHSPTLRITNNDLSWFERDPSLLLRAIRLAAQYELTIPLPIKQSIKASSSLVKKIDPQRLHIEYKRHFLRGYAVKNFEYLVELDLFSVLYPKTALFLKSTHQKAYQEWLFQELEQTDKLVSTQQLASMAYVYALFLSGGVLETLGKCFKSVAYKLDQITNQVVEEAFPINFDCNYLDKINLITFNCVKKLLYTLELNKSIDEGEKTQETNQPTPLLTQFQLTSCSKKPNSLNYLKPTYLQNGNDSSNVLKKSIV